MIISISLLAPSPRITKERAEAWEAREVGEPEPAHVCQGDCLPAFASSSSHTHLARLGMAKLGRGFPHTTPPSSSSGENVDFGFSFSLCFFSFIFFCENGENEGGREGEYHIGHMSLFHIRIRCGISPTAPSHTTRLRLSLPNPHYRARWDQAFFFVIVSSESPPSVRHPRPVYVYVPRRTHPSGSLLLAPLTSFFFSSSLLSHALSLCLSTTAGFLFPSPSGSAPPSRPNRTLNWEGRASPFYLHFAHQFTAFFFLLIFRFSSQQPTNRPHKQKQPMIHVFLFAIHRNDLSPVPLDSAFPSYFCTHISFSFLHFFFLSNAYIPNVCDS